jgi:ammonium transporter, Amt family
MTPSTQANDLSLWACVVLVAIVPLALAGLVLMNAGLGRTRSAAHSMLASMAAMAVAALVYCMIGFSWEGIAGGPAHSLMLAGRRWDWIAAAPFCLRGLPPAATRSHLQVLLQVFAVALAALIPLSAGADRWRISASCFSTALLAGWTYPLFAHWVWGGGWLAQLGSSYGLGRGFIDSGGASTIQVVGGLTALSIVWIIGPRRGKFAQDGIAPAIPGHNIVYVLFGALLIVPGWIALNAAGAILFTGAGAGQTPLIAINTVLSAAAAGLTALVITRFRFGKPDASLSANGWVSGLVASSAVCAFVSPLVAIGTGLIAGGLATAAVELLELRLGVDDPGGAISVHAVAGLWGLLAAGLFAGSERGQLTAQIVGVATLLGVILPLTYTLNWLLDRLRPQRTTREGERLGMDLHELGAGAYPEFMIHTDDFIER